MANKQEFTFDSRDGATKIHAVKWVPKEQVVGIVQIIHGMAEYIDRYSELAEFLAQKGFLVTGEDHLGHGKTVPDGGTYGYFCKQDPATVVVRDVHRLKKITQEEYPGVPYIILGHSMGSFILRNYLFRYGTGIQGAIICGTGRKPQVLIVVSKLMASVQGFCMGEKHIAKTLDSLAFGSCNKRIVEKKTTFDWLCTEENVVKKYVEDPLCGFKFTVNGFKTLFSLISRLNKKENIELMPKKLPILFIAGGEDPIGDYGIGVEGVFNQFREAGMTNLSLKIYKDSRHEILNDKEKKAVHDDIYLWVKEQNL